MLCRSQARRAKEKAIHSRFSERMEKALGNLEQQVEKGRLKNRSKIERRYEAGDQRRWHVPCPSCGEAFVFEWGPNFRFEQAFPHKAYYVAPCCDLAVLIGSTR